MLIMICLSVSGSLKEDCFVSIEIKHKCGFLPTSEFIAEENAVLKRITRFKMHQVLKLNQGKVIVTPDLIQLLDELFSLSMSLCNILTIAIK
ncbi:hypothetical protein ACS0TY_014292 [Phlomoides rotata]